MKKIVSLFSLAGLVAASMFFSSCNTETLAPTIALSNGTSGSIEVFKILSFDVTMNSDDNAELKTLTVTAKIAGIDKEIVNKDISGQKSYVFPFSDTILAGATSKEYTFLVTDNKSKTATATYTLTITSPTSWKAIDTRSGADLDNEFGSTQFWSFSVPGGGGSQSMTISEAKANANIVDFVYGSRAAGNGANFIGATSSADAKAVYDNTGSDKLSTWSKLNPTQLKLTALTPADWTKITNDSAIVANTSSGMTNSVNNLNKNGGQIISFVLVNGKKGLIYVKGAQGAFEPIPTGTVGALTWDYKIQQ